MIEAVASEPRRSGRWMSAEVLIADHMVADGRLQVDVCVPSAHPHAVSGAGALSSALLLEVWRQGAFLAAHEVIGVPVDWQFELGEITLTWTQPPPLLCSMGALWGEVFVTTEAADCSSVPSAITGEFEFQVNGRVVAVGRFAGSASPSNAWANPRHGDLASSADASSRLRR
ncbi:AfsA-related hotdog domain-containing protein [Microbacterium rhizomatis]|uniref:A-factor biosynthesis hotdog domain-containing protein n=1 Tax=Microbacterium rhizomatis TaxID=1631477 RepID=A0A5J5IYX1_9MICO|nr:AfsA-related hotdog domain-containing protein [Microbacterium rhizomatis]KAA9107526.1 hypothetical protein F6B43_08610 [Microbacterium rhizomatis]